MKSLLARALMALMLSITLLTQILPRAHAHEGMDHSGASASETAEIGDLAISGAFARATLPNAPVGGGYLTITNTGNEADTLTGARAEVAGEVQLHQMSMAGDVMRMEELPGGIVIPAGETVTLAPGGLHLMFLGIGQPFIEGECVETTLIFAVAGEVSLCLPVAAAGAEHAGH